MILDQPPLWVIVIAFFAAIGPLVIIHELGHYWVARLFGVGAEQFSIGFGREVGGWTDRRGTRWRIGWLPLGGYVKFVGDQDALSLEQREDAAPPRASGLPFHTRPPWQRFLIILAGPIANFALAILIYAAFFASFGMPRTTSQVTAVQPGSAAAAAGIVKGDRILSVAGRSTETFEDITQVVAMRPGETVTITIDRGGQRLALPATLATTTLVDNFGQKARIGRLGVYGPRPKLEPVAPLDWLPTATVYTGKLIQATWDGLAQIVTGQRPLKELGGPLRMAQIAGQQASLGLLDFVQLLAFFSINLGFINLLPVPVLDGGHLVLTTLEAIRRKPVSERAVEWAVRGGLAFLLALMLVVTFNDLAAFGLWDRVGRLIG